MSTPSTYQLICGLEVHAELKTKSKMFCGCKNDPFHAEQPNIYTCPVCLGMPGGLPVPNKTAIEWVIKLGLALHCKINLFSKFDRKHYFYPDLPKGYQISQYDIPFCYDGYIDTSEGRVKIHRIHLEEDTGKLLHTNIDGAKVTLVDFNRGGVPLVEVVTEPDIHSATQATEYAKKLRRVIKFLNIGDCDMQKGGMRLEANLSLSPDGSLPNYKVELKNINSFKFMEQAIAYEINRQTTLLNQGETPIQETRGWDIQKLVSFSQRTKEEAADYRYFPDPDIPPLHFTEAEIEALKNELPELPEAIEQRWQTQLHIEPRYTDILVQHRDHIAWLDGVFAVSDKANDLAKALVNKQLSLDSNQTPADTVAQYKQSIATEAISDDELTNTIKEILAAEPDAVAKYHDGKTQVIGYLLGQVAARLKKKLDMQTVRAKMLELL